MTAREFYRSAEDERLDKEQLERLFTAIDPVEKAFRRKDHAWTITARHSPESLPGAINFACKLGDLRMPAVSMTDPGRFFARMDLWRRGS